MSVPSAELIAVGSELLGPSRLDTNGGFLARRLGERGIAVRFRTIVGDAPDDLREALRVALSRAELIVATGGLGPTVDDVTRETAAAVLGRTLVEDAAILKGIEERYRRFGRDMPENNRRQAMVPEGAVVIPNPLGSAPGLLLESEGRRLVLLPGVPAEMERMVDDALLDRLAPRAAPLVSRVLKIAGLTESEVDRRLLPVYRQAGRVEWTILASPGQIEIHLRDRAGPGGRSADIERLDAAVAAIVGPALFARDDDTMERVVGGLLASRGETAATAESVTGGRIARRLTSVPGASTWYRGGAVVYTNDAKILFAGVEETILARSGAVSAEVALALAEGIRTRLRSTWGLSTTGYAGPDTGEPRHPAGTVFLGLSGPGTALARALRLPGDRVLVQARAGQAALDLLRRALLGIAA